MNSNSCATWLVCEVSFAWQLQLVQCNVIEGLQAAYVLRYILPRYDGHNAHYRHCFLKAEVYRRWLVPARALCKAMKAKVDETEVFQYLHHSWTAPEYKACVHDPSLGFSEESWVVVTILRMKMSERSWHEANLRKNRHCQRVRELTRPLLEDLGHEGYSSPKRRRTRSDTPS
jgi:hypothetical protein